MGDAADVSAVAADQNPLAAALKRFSSAPSSALAAASAAPPALPPGAAALYGAAAAAAAACAAARGRASSAAGDDRDAELDAAAQNLRLRSKRDATPNTCVYVGFLGWWVSEKELEACFAPHGKLVSVRVSGRGKGRARGPAGRVGARTRQGLAARPLPRAGLRPLSTEGPAISQAPAPSALNPQHAAHAAHT